MEPRPSTSAACYGGRGGGPVQPGVAQQATMNPTPGPSSRPCLTNPISVPPHFISVPPEQLLPHQVRSGIDIGNLFKLLNALQNRIALACSQHQYLRDPLHHVRPPDNGGAYKPLTPEAAVKDIRSLYRQQRNLMEKLRRWNCINEGKCYDLIINGTYEGICVNCKPFVASRRRMKKVGKALRKQRVKTKRKLEKRLKAAIKARKKSKTILANKAKVSATQPTGQQLPSPKKRRKKVAHIFEPPHPQTFLTQENFLSNLGLVTPEVYQKAQAESRRTERRRRTTANPKYKSNVFVDPNEVSLSKRSRRSDPSNLQEPPPNSLPTRLGAERRKARQKRYECTVCEKGDVDVECNSCLSGFHSACIKVSASKAAPPSTVTVCPNCVFCNPNISASDCILLSRRISRPSIMGLKTSSDESTEAAPNRNTSGNQKAPSARRKPPAKKSSQRRNAAPVKQKKPTASSNQTSTGPAKKLRTTQSNKSKSSTSRRTLNHMSAVAAAAAVPAYCSAGRQPAETVTHATTNRTPVVQQPPPKKVTPQVVGIKWNTNHSKLRGRTQRRPCLKRPISPSTQPKAHFETVTVNKVIAVKANILNTSKEEATEGRCTKQATKCKKTVVVVNSYVKSTSDPQAIIPKKKPVVKKSELKVTSKTLIQTSKPAATTSEGNSTNSAPSAKVGESKASVAKSPQTKITTPKYKKLNGLKTGPSDPFCMKRTMMAMSAAAGIVMSNSGMKVPPTSSSTTPLKPSTPFPTAAAINKHFAFPTPPRSTEAALMTSSTPKENSTPIQSSLAKQIVASASPTTKAKQPASPTGSMIMAKQAVSSPGSAVKAKVKQAVVSPGPTPKQIPSAVGSTVKQIVSPIVSVTNQAASATVSSKTVRAESKPAAIGPSGGIKPGINSKQVKEKPVKVTTTPSPPKKKQSKPKSTPNKSVPKMDPAIEQSISETISRVIFESAHGLYMDKKENLYQKVTRNILDNELNRSRASGASENSGNIDNARLDYSDSPPPPVLTSYMKGSTAQGTGINNSCGKSLGSGKVDTSYDFECSESPASNSSTIGSSRSLRELDSDDSTFELLSIPGTPYRRDPFP